MKNDRRALLKALTLGTGAVGAAKLPTVWTKPVVDSVTLPAHAQTTEAVLSGSVGVDLEFIAGTGRGQDPFRQLARRDPAGSLLQRIIPEAHAGEGFHITSSKLKAYVEPRGPGEYLVEVLLQIEAEDHDIVTTSEPGFNHSNDGGLMDSLVNPAHALIDYVVCYSSVLWSTMISTSGDPATGSKKGVGIDDSCGGPDIGLGAELDLKLTVESATSGELKVEGGPIKEKISLSAGGSPLSVDCKGDPCKFLIREQ